MVGHKLPFVEHRSFFHAYLQPELSEYDAWFNVKDNQLVLSVSVKDSSKTEYYYARFIVHMEEKHKVGSIKILGVEKALERTDRTLERF